MCACEKQTRIKSSFNWKLKSKTPDMKVAFYFLIKAANILDAISGSFTASIHWHDEKEA